MVQDIIGNPFADDKLPVESIRRVNKAGGGVGVNLTKWLRPMGATLVRIVEVESKDGAVTLRIEKVA